MISIFLRTRTLAAIYALAAATLATPSHALPPLPAVPSPGVEVTHAFGSEFVTVGNAGNAGIPWHTFEDPPFYDRVEFQGRGVVPYEYRIARTEISTSQWMEFVNVFSVQGYDAVPQAFRGTSFILGPYSWGARIDSTFSGHGNLARRYQVRTDIPNAGDLPVFGIAWREAALYCNWLNNGKPTTWDGILTGSYDTSTWSRLPTSVVQYTDGDRLPGAVIFMPTLDEWLKAGFYDPNRNGQGEEGWWEFANQSAVPLRPGLPGVGNTGAGIYAPELPLVSYPYQQSAYGLFDISGGASELTDSWDVMDTVHSARVIAGAGQDDFERVHDIVDPYGIYSRFNITGLSYPVFGSTHGLRLAMSVPCPSSGLVIITLGWISIRRRRCL